MFTHSIHEKRMLGTISSAFARDISKSNVYKYNVPGKQLIKKYNVTDKQMEGTE